MRIGNPQSTLWTIVPTKATAAKFEGLFVREMLKSMRSAKLGESLTDTDADDHWRDMQDQLFADALAAKSPLGVAAHLPAAKP